MTNYRPTWAEISRGAFAANVRRAKSMTGRHVEMMAVLKADGYGHGAEALAPLAIKNGAASIGVSSIEEGVALRNAGVRAPILILGGLFPLKNFSVAQEFHLIPTVASFFAARALARAAAEAKRPFGFHLKVDTGMGRIGVSPDEANRILSWAARRPQLEVEGVYTHFATADVDGRFVRRQLKQFSRVKIHAVSLGLKGIAFHAANSAALLRYPDTYHEAIRPGLILYGLSPFGGSESGFRPVLSWHTRIVFLKTVAAGTAISYGRTFRAARRSRIATLPVGYADGLPRRASNKGAVLVGGRRCPIVGRVTMDHIMVDVTGRSAAVGDAVTIIGEQGPASLSAWDWAAWAGTSAYEICCQISKRVPRVLVA